MASEVKSRLDIEFEAAKADGVNPHVLNILLMLAHNDYTEWSKIGEIAGFVKAAGEKGILLSQDLLDSLERLRAAIDRQEDKTHD